MNQPPSSPRPRTVKSLRRPLELESRSPLLQAIYQLPELDRFNQSVLEYWDIEDLLQLYNQRNYQFFEDPVTLNLLTQRFRLPQVTSFDEFVSYYDRTYATTRSYFRKPLPPPRDRLFPQRTPEEILVQACREGNAPAFRDGLLLNPDLMIVEVLNSCLAGAGFNGGEEIINAVLITGRRLEPKRYYGESPDYYHDLDGDLLPEVFDKNQLLAGLITGNHIELLGRFLANDNSPARTLEDRLLSSVAGESANITMIDFCISHGMDPNEIVGVAAINGRDAVVAHLIDRGADASCALVGAVDGHHPDLVRWLVPLADLIEIDHQRKSLCGDPDAATIEALLEFYPNEDPTRWLLQMLEIHSKDYEYHGKHWPQLEAATALLLDRGARVTYQGLKLAVSTKDPEILRLLLDAGPQVHDVRELHDTTILQNLKTNWWTNKRYTDDDAAINLMTAYLSVHDPEDIDQYVRDAGPIDFLY